MQEGQSESEAIDGLHNRGRENSIDSGEKRLLDCWQNLGPQQVDAEQEWNTQGEINTLVGDALQTFLNSEEAEAFRTAISRVVAEEMEKMDTRVFQEYLLSDPLPNADSCTIQITCMLPGGMKNTLSVSGDLFCCFKCSDSSEASEKVGEVKQKMMQKYVRLVPVRMDNHSFHRTQNASSVSPDKYVIKVLGRKEYLCDPQQVISNHDYIRYGGVVFFH